jgi:putative SOS response-associated peptidase YedK
MCNDYRLNVEASAIPDDFAKLKIKVWSSEGAPNIQPRDDIKIMDTVPIVGRWTATIAPVTSFSGAGAGRRPRGTTAPPAAIAPSGRCDGMRKAPAGLARKRVVQGLYLWGERKAAIVD